MLASRQRGASSDAFAVKLDASGATTSNKVFGRSSGDELTDLDMEGLQELVSKSPAVRGLSLPGP